MSGARKRVTRFLDRWRAGTDDDLILQFLPPSKTVTLGGKQASLRVSDLSELVTESRAYAALARSYDKLGAEYSNLQNQITRLEQETAPELPPLEGVEWKTNDALETLEGILNRVDNQHQTITISQQDAWQLLRRAKQNDDGLMPGQGQAAVDAVKALWDEIIPDKYKNNAADVQSAVKLMAEDLRLAWEQVEQVRRAVAPQTGRDAQ